MQLLVVAYLVLRVLLRAPHMAVLLPQHGTMGPMKALGQAGGPSNTQGTTPT